MSETTSLKGACHCGAIQFTLTAAPDSVTRCTCSLCHKRGTLWAYYAPDQFTLTTAPERVSTYQFGHYLVRHHHCSVCGCGAYFESPAWAEGKADFTNMKIGVNAWLLEDFDPLAAPLLNVDGKNDW